VPKSTVVTYLGGSAGDMFAASANGIIIDFGDSNAVSRPAYSLKDLESLIVSGTIDLARAVNDRPFDFVTTHLYRELIPLGLPTITITISDQRTMELTVLRQMQIQTLKITAKHSDTAYRLIKNAVDRQDWPKAARIWFAMAERKWYHDHKFRLDHPLPGTKTLDFYRLYHSDFVDTLRTQGFGINLDILEKNHSAWLSRNLHHNRESTLASMAEKIRCMDWNQQDGYVTCYKS